MLGDINIASWTGTKHARRDSRVVIIHDRGVSANGRGAKILSKKIESGDKKPILDWIGNMTTYCTESEGAINVRHKLQWGGGANFECTEFLDLH